MIYVLTYFLFLIFCSLINLTNADEYTEAAALCAFITATNINSKRNDWSCANINNRCSWSGITCQNGQIINFDLGNSGVSGKSHILL